MQIILSIHINQWFSYIVSFAVTIFFIIALKPVAQHINLVDYPGGRKVHQGEVPLIGGIAMFLGFCFAILTLNISLEPFRAFLASSLLLVIVGVLDDMHELSARLRLIAQLIASLMMIFWAGVKISSIGDVLMLGNMNIGYFSFPFTIIATIASINAINMLDGLDGLAASISLMQLLMVLILLSIGHQIEGMILILTLLTVVVAFLLFNFPWKNNKKASVFMGDSGSMFLGLAITWFLIKYSQGIEANYSPVIILWILAVPVFDIITVTFFRIKTKRSPAEATRDHIHHLLNAMGIKPKNCVLLLTGASLAFGAVGIIGTLYHIKDYWMFTAFLLSYIAYAIFYSNALTRLSLKTLGLADHGC